jgi:hypothetical protein
MLLEITINGGNKIHIKRIRDLPGDPKNMESSYYADVHPDGKHIENISIFIFLRSTCHEHNH